MALVRFNLLAGAPTGATGKGEEEKEGLKPQLWTM